MGCAPANTHTAEGAQHGHTEIQHALCSRFWKLLWGNTCHSETAQNAAAPLQPHCLQSEQFSPLTKPGEKYLAGFLHALPAPGSRCDTVLCPSAACCCQQVRAQAAHSSAGRAHRSAPQASITRCRGRAAPGLMPRAAKTNGPDSPRCSVLMNGLTSP